MAKNKTFIHSLQTLRSYIVKIQTVLSMVIPPTVLDCRLNLPKWLFELAVPEHGLFPLDTLDPLQVVCATRNDPFFLEGEEDNFLFRIERFWAAERRRSRLLYTPHAWQLFCLMSLPLPMQEIFCHIDLKIFHELIVTCFSDSAIHYFLVLLTTYPYSFKAHCTGFNKFGGSYYLNEYPSVWEGNNN